MRLMRPAFWVDDFRIETDRLVLRTWRARDIVPLHAMGRDPRVMAHLGPLTGRTEAKRIVSGENRNQSLFGHCFWALERRSDAVLLGLCGLNPGPADTPLAGRIEISWRLAHHAWRQGYAFEAAHAALDWAWTELDVRSVWAVTVPENTASQRLMVRLGMRRHPELDFDHATQFPDDPLCAHVTYSIRRPS